MGTEVTATSTTYRRTSRWDTTLLCALLRGTFSRLMWKGWRWLRGNDLVCCLIRCSSDICFLRENCNSGTLIHFVMNDWMSAQAMKSPRGKCASLCVCVQHCETFPSVWQKHSPTNTGTVSVQSLERGGIQDGLKLIGIPFKWTKKKWNKDGVDITLLNLS